MTAKWFVQKTLLAFALISLGFAAGKEYALRKAQKNPSTDLLATPPIQSSGVVAYYFHGTFRCKTCNAIERLAKNIIETEFAEDLKTGRLRFVSIDFQKQKDLADQLSVASSTLVLARQKNGQITDFQRLDDVWTTIDNPAAFAEYVRQSVQAFLTETQQ